MRPISAKSSIFDPYLNEYVSVILPNVNDYRKHSTYFSICSLPAFPKSCAAPGAFVTPLVSFMIEFVVAIGFERSWKKVCKLPGNIFSKPTTNSKIDPGEKRDVR
jgi:hypothetical protein